MSRLGSDSADAHSVWEILIRPAFLMRLSALPIALSVLVIVTAGIWGDWGFDFTCCYQQAASRALDAPSTLYDWSQTYTFRYTPLGALFFVPLVPFSPAAAVWVWFAVKVAVLLLTAAWFARSWQGSCRWLVALLVLAFPPVVHDLVIGNVSTLTLLVLLAVSRWPDARGGALIGLLMVLMPKPHLLPVLAYLAIRRSTSFVAALATIAAGLAIGLVLFGIEPWLAFIDTLREPLGRTFTGNIAFSGLFGPLGVVVGLVAAGFVLVIGVLVGGSRGYGLSIVAGILMGPYSFLHYLVGTLVAAEPVLRTRPRWLVPFPWLLLVFPLIPFSLLGLAWAIRNADD